MQLTFAGERGQEDVMVARVLSDQYDAGYRRGGIGMLLRCGIPERVRIALLAYREANLWCQWVARERQREADLHGRAIRPLAVALERKHLRAPDPRLCECCRIGGHRGAFQDDGGESLLPLKIFLRGAAEVL